MGQLVNYSHLRFRSGSGNRARNTGASPSSTNWRGRLLRWRRLQSHSVDRFHRRFLRDPGSFRCITVDETRLLDLEFAIRHLVVSGQFIEFLKIRAFGYPPERHLSLCHQTSPTDHCTLVLDVEANAPDRRQILHLRPNFHPGNNAKVVNCHVYKPCRGCTNHTFRFLIPATALRNQSA